MKQHNIPVLPPPIPCPEQNELITHISRARNPSGDILEAKYFVPLGQNMGELTEGSQAERLIIPAWLSIEAGLEAV